MLAMLAPTRRIHDTLSVIAVPVAELFLQLPTAFLMATEFPRAGCLHIPYSIVILKT
jgi:hypothetical protein